MRHQQFWPWITVALVTLTVTALRQDFGKSNIKALSAMNYGQEGKANFIMHNSLEGKIQISSSSRDKKIPCRINLLDLDTESPSVIFEGVYGARMPFRKLYEDSDSLIIQQQAGSSLDVITINKKNGVFVRMASGITAGTYVIAEKGQLD